MPKKKDMTPTDKAVKSDVSSKMSAIRAALKKSGATVVVDLNPDAKQARMTTGVLSIDDALSGGILQGRITEFFGEEQSGKSLVSLLTVAEAQKQGKTCMYIDVEYGFQAEWAAKLGVNVKELILPDIEIPEGKDEIMEIMTAEKVFQIICDVAMTKEVDLIVVDSIAAMITEDEFTKELTEDRYASLAKKLKEGLGKAVPILAKTGTSLILINQVRDDIGSYIKSVHTPGGRALKHLISTRVMFKKSNSSEQIKDGDNIIGVDITCKVIKHRGGPNFRPGVFRIWYESGFDKEYDLFNFMKIKNLITQSGPYFYWRDFKAQGEGKFLEALKSNKELHDLAYQAAMDIINNAKKQAIEEADKIEPKEE